MSGRLVVVGTPIGNLGDCSPRAAEALRTADRIACEDTRRTGKLTTLLGIEHGPLVVLNDHTEAARADELVAAMSGGQVVALVSDAGMPGIADPGERLVAAAVAAGVPVEVVPGPTAPIAALVASGLPTARFVVDGFLPRKGSARTRRLAEVAGEVRTVVLLEAPHRLGGTLEDLAAACGADRRVAVARELTKLHEEVWRGTLADAAAWAEAAAPRGELVIVIAGAPPSGEPDDDAVRAALAEAMATGLRTKDAASEVAERLGISRRRAYELATST